MRVFTVHHREGEVPRLRLLPERFSGWAFLLGPVWMIRHGLWLALLGYLAATAAIALLPTPWIGWAVLAVHLLLGLHGHDLRRWTLRRRGFAPAGVVVAADEDEALLRLIRARPLLARGALA